MNYENIHSRYISSQSIVNRQQAGLLTDIDLSSCHELSTLLFMIVVEFVSRSRMPADID
jgi:hypothetical protein